MPTPLYLDQAVMVGRRLYQNETVWLVTGGTSVLSIAVCAAAIALLIAMRLHAFFTYRLVAYQALSLILLDFSYSLVLLQFVPYPSFDQNICVAIGFLVVYSVWVNLLFSLSAVLHLFCFTVFYRSLKKLEPFYVAVCVLLPFLYCWVPFGTRSYGSDNFLCFVETWSDAGLANKSSDGIVEEFTLFYGPLVGIAGMNTIVVLTMMAILARRPLGTRDADGSLPSRDFVTSTGRNYKMKLMKQLCPLATSALFVLGFVMFPFGARIYDAIFASHPHNQFELDLAIGVVAGISGMCLGSSLIVHLCYVRKTKRFNQNVPPSASDALVTRRGRFFNYHASSLSVNDTVYSFPRESEIDEVKRQRVQLLS